MDNHSNSFVSLLTGYLTDELSAEQYDLFMHMLQDPANQLLLEQGIDVLAREHIVSSAGNAGLEARSLLLLKDKINAMQVQPQLQRMPVRRKYLAAAAIALLLAAGAWLWFSEQSKNNIRNIAVKGKEPEPGKDGAILTLADGRKLLLDSMGNGVIAKEQGAELTLNNGTLRYNIYNQPAAATGFNTVSTPRGRQIQLNLPDGTKAWLNAGSSLHFPTAFNNAERKVEMTGEVFFEVAKDAARPFVVQVAEETSVEVLGTAFNINAYSDEPSISTTLTEGAVKMNFKQQSLTLDPGQQGVAAAGTLKQRTVDIDEITAWKNGRFEFDGNIRDIMRQLQRWYNIDKIIYQTDTEKCMLVGTFIRTQKLSEVLATLEKTGSVHFTIEGETVTVKP